MRTVDLDVELVVATGNVLEQTTVRQVLEVLLETLEDVVEESVEESRERAEDTVLDDLIPVETVRA
ncbi:hypothetical protein, partial [Streptomyces griseoaurantiacus]|uniref:hypothetical protein n=1 Tax=Streptomyces griseoaurantiacus TaxID=68213 RepID=UPI0034604384